MKPTAGMGERGAAAVEFALLLPVFAMLLAGIVEFGRLMWARTSMEYAVEEATRYAIAHTDATVGEIEAYAGARLRGVPAAEVDISAVSSNDEVAVRATHQFSLVTGGLLGVETVALDVESRFPRR